MYNSCHALPSRDLVANHTKGRDLENLLDRNAEAPEATFVSWMAALHVSVCFTPVQQRDLLISIHVCNFSQLLFNAPAFFLFLVSPTAGECNLGSADED